MDAIAAKYLTGPVDWLDSVKVGYGSRFAAAFAAVGYEDADDIQRCIPDLGSLTSLLRAAGAGAPQQQRIHEAIVALVGGPLPKTTLVGKPGLATLAAAAANTRDDLVNVASPQASSGPRPTVTPHKYVTDGTVVVAKPGTSPALPASTFGDQAFTAGLTTGAGHVSSAAAAAAADADDDDEDDDDDAPAVPLPTDGSGSTAPALRTAPKGERRQARARSPPSASSSRPLSSTSSRIGKPMQMHKIFKYKKWIMISYQWDHQKQVVTLRTMLEKHGVSCWMDIDNFKTDIYDSMAAGVQGAFCILACMSQQYEDSSNCKLELKFAQQTGVPIVPVMMSPDWKASGWLGIITAGALWTPMYDDFETNAKKLILQIQRSVDAVNSKFDDDDSDYCGESEGEQTSTEDEDGADDFSVDEMRAELERLMNDLRVAKLEARSNLKIARSSSSSSSSNVDSGVDDAKCAVPVYEIYYYC